MQMIKTTCDFCPEALEPNPATGTVQIDTTIYDICERCKKEMKDLLAGKGRSALLTNGTAPIVFPWPVLSPPPIGTPPAFGPVPNRLPYIGDPPYDQWPTVICQNTCKAEGTSNANPR
jgi:hypothetical protein